MFRKLCQQRVSGTQAACAGGAGAISAVPWLVPSSARTGTGGARWLARVWRLAAVVEWQKSCQKQQQSCHRAFGCTAVAIYANQFAFLFLIRFRCALPPAGSRRLQGECPMATDEIEELSCYIECADRYKRARPVHGHQRRRIAKNDQGPRKNQWKPLQHGWRVFDRSKKGRLDVEYRYQPWGRRNDEI